MSAMVSIELRVNAFKSDAIHVRVYQDGNEVFRDHVVLEGAVQTFEYHSKELGCTVEVALVPRSTC